MTLIKKKKFGITKTGEEVYAYTLKNNFLEIVVLNYGGIIQKIMMPDKNGKFENIVLGFDSIEDYEERSPFFGAIIGRTAGRIKRGELVIDNKVYELSKNDFGNNLHGYPDCYGNKVWDSEVRGSDGEIKLVLTRTSPHLEANYPGEINFTVIYTLDENKLTLEYEGKPDRKTYMNLTNHTYFNLSGDYKEDIGNQIIILNSDEYLKVDKETIPTEISKVEGTIFDLRKGRKFEEIFNSKDGQIEIVNGGFDHPFVFNKNSEELDAKCYDEKSGRILEVKTTEPVVVLYTGNHLENIGKISNETVCKKHLGFCLETQDYPDVGKFIPEKSRVYTSKEKYYQKTSFVFSVNLK